MKGNKVVTYLVLLKQYNLLNYCRSMVVEQSKSVVYMVFFAESTLPGTHQCDVESIPQKNTMYTTKSST